MMTSNSVRLGSLVLAVLLVIVSAPAGSTQDRTVIKVTAERFTFTPAQIKVKRGAVIEFRCAATTPTTASASSAPTPA